MRQAYDGQDAAASIVGTVVSAKGTGPSATYKVRRVSILSTGTSESIPSQTLIDVSRLWMGTCGLDSPLLQRGDKIVLYFMALDGRLVPRGWKKI